MYDSQGHRLGVCYQDGLGRSVREDRCGVPAATQDLECQGSVVRRRGVLTTSFNDTGALSADAISCAFCETLPFLVRTVRNASLRLFRSSRRGALLHGAAPESASFQEMLWARNCCGNEPLGRGELYSSLIAKSFWRRKASSEMSGNVVVSSGATDPLGCRRVELMLCGVLLIHVTTAWPIQA